ncbi:unnamed protein product [Rotaria sordida]|uniref:Uncharacterized protein n=1 Tax=Rotaria sordida TaxID=392033 RepID=A0A819Q466_9BILA|nr:unnamed protein product [Rotaria sordida]CAF4022716.1 unnamed protein product [Rotaria sordida]
MMFMKIDFLLVLIIVTDITVGYHQQCTQMRRCFLPFENVTAYPPECEEKLTYDDECRTTWSIDFIKRQIVLEYGHIELHGPPTYATYLQLFVDLNKNTKSISAYYRCTTSDDCARKFYESYIRLYMRKESIFNEIQELLFDKNSNSTSAQTIECYSYTANRILSCESGGCVGGLLISKNLSYYEVSQRCADPLFDNDWQPASFQMRIMERYPREYFDQYIVQFICNKRLCNDKEEINKFKELSNQYHQWPLYNMISTQPTNSSEKRSIINYFLIVSSIYLWLI